jgi:hypothetical protein
MRKPRVKISDRLMDRLCRESILDWSSRKSMSFSRCYPGYWQRSSGAWSWEISVDGVVSVGSCYTAKECCDADKLVIGENGDITPLKRVEE